MKPYPCCKGTHNYVDVALDLVNKHEIKPGDVQEITVFCKDKEYFLLHPLEKRSRPENPVDSQFSIPWAVAAVFARGRAGVGEFTEEAIRSADILDISGKIRVELDADLKQAKGMDPAKIGVTTKRGQTYIEAADIPPDGAEKPLPLSAYERKFRDCAAYSVKPLSDKQIDGVIAKIGQLERVDDIREVIKLLS
jgi:2-methylcitrate dehydratase PrpD